MADDIETIDTPAPEPAAPEPAAPASDHPDSVPWDDHVALRHENAEYRKQWSPYEKAFAGYDDESRDAWLEFFNMAREDPDGATAYLASILGLQPGEEPEVGAEEQQPLSREEMLALLEQRDAASAEERAIEEVERKAESLGYTLTDDEGRPNRDYIDLLHRTVHEHDGDVAAAHEARLTDVENLKKQLRDETLRRKAGDTTPTPVPAGGGGPSDEVEITDLKQSRAALAEWANAQPG